VELTQGTRLLIGPVTLSVRGSCRGQRRSILLFPFQLLEQFLERLGTKPSAGGPGDLWKRKSTLRYDYLRRSCLI